MDTIKHISWPDIGQYRNVIRTVKERAQFSHLDANGDAVFDNCKPLPTLQFKGTIKLHGTNACIAFYGEDTYFQSRERMISVHDDNAGFCRFFYDLKASGVKPFRMVNRDIVFATDIKQATESEYDPTVRVYGEWCGGNIQAGVALNQLPKMFVIIGCKVGNIWLTPEEVATFPAIPEHSIYNVYNAKTFDIDIDFNKPEIAQNELIKLVEEVEKMCPWGQKFGVEGVGEGIVFRCITPGYEGTKFYFKAKGEKHSVSKVKTIAPVDIEKVNSERAFCEMVVTDARCKQMIQKVKESGVTFIDRTSIGAFLRLLFNDILKEESDVAAGNNIELSKINGMISTYGKQWFFKNESTFDTL